MNGHLLKACPFCGSTDLEWNSTAALEIRGKEIQTEWIECNNCGVIMEDKLVDGVSEKYGRVDERWNRRA